MAIVKGISRKAVNRIADLDDDDDDDDMPNANGKRNANAKVRKVKRGRTPRPDGISNAEWFIRIANKRVPNALRALKGIARLGNVDSYEYSEKQARKIIRALESHVEMVRNALENPVKGSVKVSDAPFFSRNEK